MNEQKLKTWLSLANDAHALKIRYAKKTRCFNLYLEHYSKGNRERHFLNILLSLTNDQKKQDEQKVRIAIEIRDQKEQIILQGGSLNDAFINKDQLLFDFAENNLSDKAEKNRKLYMLSVNRFLTNYPDSTIQSITPSQAMQFRTSIKNLSNTTQRHYIRSLRYVLEKAVQASITPSNPFNDIKIKPKKAEKHYLSIEEIKKVLETDCDNLEVKKAFIFSCFTGLRIGDIQQLETSNVSEGYLHWQQGKTGSFERIKLPDIALHQINPNREGRLFLLPAYKSTRLHLKALIQNSGISKPITFHCARHTFATMCLTLGVDIYTVSKLLGHSDVRVTQVYAKLIDKKKDNATQTLNSVWKNRIESD